MHAPGAATTPDRALRSSTPTAFTNAKTATDVMIQTTAQHVQTLAALSAGALGATAKADIDVALGRVVEGLKAVEGRGSSNVGWALPGYASASFANFVKDVMRAGLRAERVGLVRAKTAGKAMRETPSQDGADRFVENAAATAEVVLGLVHKITAAEWAPVVRVEATGEKNYIHISEELSERLDVRKKSGVYYLCYDVGSTGHGGAKVDGVAVLVFLGGEKSVRVEVLAKSVVGLPHRFEEVEWSGERWIRLATVRIQRPGGARSYVIRVEPRVAGLEAEVDVSGVLGLDSLAGLMLTDAAGGRMLNTPDPLLLKHFSMHFKRDRLETAGITYTDVGFVLHFRAIALDDEPFKGLLGDIAEKYGVRLWELLRKAKGMAVDAIAKLSKDIDRVAEEAARVGRGKGVEAGRRALFEGLERLFEEKEREALGVGRQGEALALAVAGRLLLKAAESPMGWLSLLVGDGVVDVARKRLGFSAKPAEVAEAVLRLLAVWAGAYGAEIRTEEEKGMAVYAGVEDAARVLGAVLKGDVLKRAESLAMSWSGLAGADAPKLISLLSLAQLLGVVEGKWAVELWLAHKAATATTPPEVAQVLDMFFARVESVNKVKWEGKGVNVYFNVRGLEGVERAVTLRLYTDFRHFYLYCDSFSGASAEGVLRAVAEWLRPAVEQLEGRLGLVSEEQKWPKWEGGALDLPAGVGWATFLKLWRMYNMSFPIVKGGKELLRVEVLETEADGTAKFRLWYHKWRETRPHQPYVDAKIRPYHFKDGRVGFFDYIYVNETKGIYEEHLAEIAQLLRNKGVKGVSLTAHGKQLRFTGAFRDSVLGRLGIRPELPPGEPPALEYLGGLRFRVGGREVEFGERVFGTTREFYAELKFPSRDEAINFARSLKAVGVDAGVAGSETAGYTVRLDSDTFFGLLATTNATLPGLTLLYRSDDLQVYASAESGQMRFYFTVKHGGVWRVAEGSYDEKIGAVKLWRAERDVLEAIGDAVAKALEKLGGPAEVEELKEKVDEKGKVKGYYFHIYSDHLVPFLEHAADRVETGPVDVALESKRIVVKVGDVETAIEFKPLKGKEATFFSLQDVKRTLALYKSLKEVGVRVEITPKGVKVGREAMWALVATAVERGAPGGTPGEVMPGVELLKVYSTGGVRMYVFRVSEKGVYYYFAVRTRQEWGAAGGKYSSRQVAIHGEVASLIAEAVNVIYREMGVERRIKVKYDKRYNAPYIMLANEDLRLLGLARQELDKAS